MIEIREDTRLSALMEEYPWLLDEMAKQSERLRVLKSPMVKLLLKTATVADASKRSGKSTAEIIAKIHELIAAHESM